MSNPETLLRTVTGPQKLAHVIEEATEIIHAYAKAQRFGFFDNPTFHGYTNYPDRTNFRSIEAEMTDLLQAISLWNDYVLNATEEEIQKDFQHGPLG
jgi:hypothetical protein